MAKADDIAKLEKSIKDTEIRLKAILLNVDSLTKEIDTLSDLEAKLVENIKCLKQKQIIAAANEFKKIKADLSKTKTRLTTLKNQREQSIKSATDFEEYIYKISEELEKLNQSKDNNIIQFKRGDKNGQE